MGESPPRPERPLLLGSCAQGSVRAEEATVERAGKAMIQPRELKALHLSARMFSDTPIATSVEDCVYHMQIAERCMETDLAEMAESRTDSTVHPDWTLMLSAMTTIIKHQRSAWGRATQRLNGIERARKHRAVLVWGRATTEKYKAQKAREYVRFRAKRALSRGEQHD